MGLLDMCCPKKPKKSLDYIIKWVEDADKRFKDIDTYLENLNTAINGDGGLNSRVTDLESWQSAIDSTIDDLVHDAIEKYPWSTLPDEALSRKADKVVDAIEGNLASLDANGNLVDSGINSALFELRLPFIREENGDYAIDETLKQYLNELLTLVPLRTCVPCLVSTRWWNEDIQNYSSAQYPGALCITKLVGPSITTTIYLSFSGNYFYATRTNNSDFPDTWTKFENPFAIDPAFNVVPVKSTDSTPTYNDSSLITSGAVHDALQEKADSAHTHSGIEEVIENAQSAKLYADNQVQGEPAIVIELTDNPGSPVTKSANINIDSIDNLNRALTTPSSTPEDDATKLITSKAVYDAINDIFPMGIYTVNYSSVSSGNAYISIANSTTVGTYNSFVDFISDNSSRIVSIFLTKDSTNNLSCLATLVIGEEATDPITGNSYWGCKLMIGNMEYECNVHDDTEVNSTFELQS